MFASGILSLALVLAAPLRSDQTPSEVLPKLSLEELNAFVEAGKYHRIRIEKPGQVLEATGKVETVAATGDWLIVELPGFLHAALRGLPKDHELAAGERVRFRGMIVDEGYACLQIWTYDFEKLPADTVEERAADRSAPSPALASAEPSALRYCEPASADNEPPAASPASLAKSSEEILPKAMVRDLDAATKRGEYLSVRRKMIGRRLYADAVVEKVGAWPLVRLSEKWQAHLHSHSDDMGLKEGDCVRLRGLIVDEAYSALTLWVERIEKLPVDNTSEE
jgi:hypothetical protein